MATADFSEAEWYDENSPCQKEDGLKLIKLAAPKKGDKILDYGCGTGNLTTRLSELVGPEGKVVGVDPDGERITLAKEKYSADNLEYVQGDEALIPGSNYDIIFSNHALHWCPDKDAVFKQFAAKLKKGGKCVYIACVEDEANSFIHSLPEFYGQKFRDSFESAYHYTSREEFKSITAANKFDILHTEIIVVKFPFAKVEDYVEFQKTHIRGDYNDSDFNVGAMRRHFGDGPFHIDSDYLLVVATSRN